MLHGLNAAFRCRGWKSPEHMLAHEDHVSYARSRNCHHHHHHDDDDEDHHHHHKLSFGDGTKTSRGPTAVNSANPKPWSKRNTAETLHGPSCARQAPDPTFRR